MTDPAPPQAMQAAAEAVARELRKMPGKRDERAEENIRRLAFDLATAALDAAGPHLAAAEREHCAQLAEQHSATYPAPCTMAGCPCPPLSESQHAEPFAALLRKDHRAAT